MKFASKPPRENWICQGEIAKKKEAKRATLAFLNNFRDIKYVKNTVKTPAIADGNLTANSFKPKTAIEGTIE